jgi:hypothetical protein
MYGWSVNTENNDEWFEVECTIRGYKVPTETDKGDEETTLITGKKSAI